MVKKKKQKTDKQHGTQQHSSTKAQKQSRNQSEGNAPSRRGKRQAKRSRNARLSLDRLRLQPNTGNARGKNDNRSTPSRREGRRRRQSPAHCVIPMFRSEEKDTATPKGKKKGCVHTILEATCLCHHANKTTHTHTHARAHTHTQPRNIVTQRKSSGNTDTLTPYGGDWFRRLHRRCSRW